VTDTKELTFLLSLNAKHCLRYHKCEKRVTYLVNESSASERNHQFYDDESDKVKNYDGNR
jgi:hypothetical protein